MLIQRIYLADPPLCPNCGGKMKFIRFIEARQDDVIRKILQHCGLWYDPPARALPKPSPTPQPVRSLDPASPARLIPTSSNTSAARNPISPNRPGTPETAPQILNPGDSHCRDRWYAAARCARGWSSGEFETAKWAEYVSPAMGMGIWKVRHGQQIVPLSPNPSPGGRPATPWRNQNSYQSGTAPSGPHGEDENRSLAVE